MPKKPEFTIYRLDPTDGTRLRVYDNSVHAGVLTDPGDAEENMMSVRDWLGLTGERTCLIDVRGDCMEDAGIYSGDVLVLDDLEPKNGDIVAARVNGECILRYFMREGNNVWLSPSNARKGYMPLRVTPQDELTIEGVVVNITRSTRRREYGIVSRLKGEIDRVKVSMLAQTVASDERTELVSKLKGMFFGDEDRARAFVMKIEGMDAGQVTEVVNRYVEQKWISDLSKKKRLWEVLHDAGMYDKSYANWCANVK